jgi:methionyl-tRNA formyltransferase
MKTKIVFFGSDQYGAKALEVLKKSPDLEILKIIKDKNELESLKKDNFQPDIGIVASFGALIPPDKQIDHGPIVSQFKEAIKVDDTSESLLNRLFTMGGQVLTTILPSYLEGKIELREQNHSQATYTQKLTRDDGKIDWTKPAEYLERFIRAMFPWPGAWTEIKINQKIKRLKILKAHLEKKRLVLDKVQLEGKKPVTWKQFLEGYPQVKLPF